MPTTQAQPAATEFRTRAGFVIGGEVIEDIGHALVLKVTKAKSGPRNFVGRVMAFPKNDMGAV